MAKLIFNKKKPVVKKANSRPKYIIKKNNDALKVMAPKLLHLPRKGGKDQRSIRIGKYPIPTGRILERYAYKHNLSNVLPVAKKILSNPKIIGEDEAIKKIKNKKQITYHEAVRQYKNMCPCKDSDGDGVVNMADCRPFNKNKQDVESDLYDKHGNTKMPKERILKNISGYIPLKNAIRTVEVQTDNKKIETFEPRKSKSK